MVLHLLEDHYLHSRTEKERAEVERELNELERRIDLDSYRERVRARAGGFRSAFNPALAD